jgi:DNA-binding NarL/FixJ family response regulator
MLLLDLVADTGFTAVGAAATAHEALALAEAEQPDIAIVDVNLRGARDGIGLGPELARLGISIIFTSGHSDIGDRPEVKALNPVAVLPKPCPPAQVMEALRNAARAGRARIEDQD